MIIRSQKKLNSILSLSLLVAMPSAYAQAEMKKLPVDTNSSVIEWEGRKVVGAHDGTLRLKSGELIMDGQKITGGTFVLDMSTIENRDLISSPEDKAKLEGHLKSDDFFDVEKHPEGVFTITEVIDMRAGKETGEVQLTGNLKVKGKSAPVSFPAQIEKQDGKLIGKAELKIDRSKWDIKYNSGSFFDIKKLGDKLIYDDINVALTIVAPSKS